MSMSIRLASAVMALGVSACTSTSVALSSRIGITQQPTAIVPDWLLRLDLGKSRKMRTPYQLNDKALAGIIIHQYPDSGGDMQLRRIFRSLYKGTFPYCIVFVYWNGCIRTANFTPQGQFIREVAPRSDDHGQVDPKHPIWSLVDYRWGSDPSLANYAAPRP